MLTSGGASPALTKAGAGTLTLNNSSGTLSLSTLSVQQGTVNLVGGGFALSSSNGLQAGVADYSKTAFYLSGCRDC